MSNAYKLSLMRMFMVRIGLFSGTSFLVLFAAPWHLNYLGYPLYLQMLIATLFLYASCNLLTALDEFLTMAAGAFYLYAETLGLKLHSFSYSLYFF